MLIKQTASKIMTAIQRNNNKASFTPAAKRIPSPTRIEFNGATYFDANGQEIAMTEEMIQQCLESLISEEEPYMSSAQLGYVYQMQ